MKDQPKGYALVEVLASFIILLVAMASLLAITQYARVKAINNYRYRRALYKVLGKMEWIKCANAVEATKEYIRIPFETTTIIEERGRNDLLGHFTYPDPMVVANFVQTESDYTPIVHYARFWVKIDWNEEPYMPRTHRDEGKLRSIKLVEDIYFKR